MKRSERAGRRIAPLERLPLFFDLRDRPVLLAGDSDGVAWKLDLLRAAGARILLAAPRPGPALSAALAAAPEVHHLARDWRADDLAGMTLAIADLPDPAAAALHRAARRAGIPCNVIDRPEHGDFAFGSLVNRSPVVIGISTGGTAPALAQAVRRRIETALPRTLARWARLARAWRAALPAFLPDPAARRAFWSGIAERALRESAPEADSPAAALDAALACPQAPARGRVSLVGAGPGDADLLTLKAVRALQDADVILFDALVSDEVLELARREARRMPVGKRGGRPSCRQEEINALMIRFAREGKHVVRLKAGDPMIFGRAGEEIEQLRAAGLPVTVIPGITAALAAAATLRVSLTRRGVAQSLRFVTGHARTGALPDDLDWPGLARADTTLMVYMAARTAGTLAARLQAAGLPAETPAAIAVAVGRPDERFVRCRLADLGPRLEGEIDGPVLVGIGHVFAAAEVPVRQRDDADTVAPVALAV